jgi:hypothetical protein
MTTKKNKPRITTKRPLTYWDRPTDGVQMVRLTGPQGQSCNACAATYHEAIQRYGLSHNWNRSSDSNGNHYWQQGHTYLHHLLDCVLHGELPEGEERHFADGNPDNLDDDNMKRRPRGSNRYIAEDRAKKDAARRALEQYNAALDKATGTKRPRGLNAALKLDKSLRDRDARGEL